MASSTGSSGETPSSGMSVPTGTTDIKRIRMEMTRLERDIESITQSDSARIVELERSLDTLGSDINLGFKNADRKDKQMLGIYQREVSVQKRALDHIKFDGKPYADAIVLAEGEVGGYERGNGWKVAAIAGGVLAVGALGALAYNAWFADDASATTDGAVSKEIVASQAWDPLVPAVADWLPTVDAGYIDSVIKAGGLSDMNKDTFMKNVYANMPAKAQNSLIMNQQIAQFTDGNIDNKELDGFTLNKEKAGQMYVNIHFLKMEGDQKVRYTTSPIPVTDLQAAWIDKTYKGV